MRTLKKLNPFPIYLSIVVVSNIRVIVVADLRLAVLLHPHFFFSETERKTFRLAQVQAKQDKVDTRVFQNSVWE